MSLDVVVLTDSRLLPPDDSDWYRRQVHHEDGLVLAALQRQGLRARRLAWDDPDMDWAGARCALFRTTWDYFERLPAFSDWLARAAGQTRLFNEIGLIRWNLDKHYLSELQQNAVHTVDTRYIEKGAPQTLRQLLAERGWNDAILKPAVSGAARHTYRVVPANAEMLECAYAELIQQEAMLLQPMQHSVLSQGELSLIVIDGHFSHAIRKTPKSGDFRVQDDHGGQVHPHQADAQEIAFAEAAVRAVPFDVLYARVDVIRDNHGRLAVMELEMIEPELFFRFRPQAAEELAAALARRLR
ncbi:ATP-grasp domain-containing protein [Chromobacterium haemolyticum]|uniref:ATP-grasp domain-containing protein n=1 Tax=Chromobacterium haemolyticum TaxID=394935 RepID=UPI0009DAE9E4|nr:hypothetical protein [Chromobacterium haemolyticum]OQS42538.1 hypothetical protein B0T39_05710 [Chromobacterium haemolyticum]